MMYSPPIPRVELAQTPTPILKLERLSERVGVELWVKRDDLTGLLESGNKVRKLEFLIGEALAQGADTLITCGTLQSNCCRTVAAVSARLGLRAVLALKGRRPHRAGRAALSARRRAAGRGARHRRLPGRRPRADRRRHARDRDRPRAPGRPPARPRVHGQGLPGTPGGARARPAAVRPACLLHPHRRHLQSLPVPRRAEPAPRRRASGRIVAACQRSNCGAARSTGSGFTTSWTVAVRPCCFCTASGASRSRGATTSARSA